MKKLPIILALVAAVVAAGMWLAWPSLRFAYFQYLVDQNLAPAYSKMVSASAGEPITLERGAITRDGDNYVIENVTISSQGKQPFTMTTAKTILVNPEMDFLDKSFRCDVKLEDWKLDVPDAGINFRRGYAKEMYVGPNGELVTNQLSRLEEGQVSLAGTPMLLIDSIEYGPSKMELHGQDVRYDTEYMDLKCSIYQMRTGQVSWRVSMPSANAQEGASGPLTGQMTLNDLTFGMPMMPAQHIDQVVGSGSEEGERSSGRVEINGYHLPKMLLSMAKPGLPWDQLGDREQLLINFAMDYAYDRPAKQLDIKEISLRSDGLGAFTMGASLGGLAVDQKILNDPQALQVALSQVYMLGAQLKYQDAGLGPWLWAVAAQEAGESPEQMREEIRAALNQQAQQMPLLGHLHGLLEESPHLCVDATFANPVPIAMYQQMPPALLWVSLHPTVSPCP